MNTRYFKIPLHIIMGGIAALFMSGAFAADSSLHKIVDGVAIYLGVIPAELIEGHPKAHPESGMHGGAPPVTEERYHIVIALFDAKTGARITNAKVTASLSSFGFPVGKKTLEPMLIANTISYGNYFKLSGKGAHRIQIEISGVSPDQTIHATFEHART
jgi:hypothetical protein